MADIYADDLGYEVVEAYYQFPTGTVETGDMTAMAPAGKVVIAGGVTTNQLGTIRYSYPRPANGQFFPAAKAKEWRAAVVWDQPNTTLGTGSVWAICINE